MADGLKELKDRMIKGRRPVVNWPAHIQLRDWQCNAYSAWEGRDKDDFLLVATPGAGKTRVALWIAHQMLLNGDMVRVVVVCPTEHLRRQWADAAHEVGLSLDPRWLNASGREVAEDYQGVVVTYQQVSFAPDLFDKQCEEATLVIFDEYITRRITSVGAQLFAKPSNALRSAWHSPGHHFATTATRFRLSPTMKTGHRPTSHTATPRPSPTPFAGPSISRR